MSSVGLPFDWSNFFGGGDSNSQLSANNPDIQYDAGSTGGPGGSTGSPNSTFDLNHIFDLLSAGVHAFTAQSAPGAPTAYPPSVPTYSAPPSSAAPPGAPPPTTSTTPQWVHDLTDFNTPTPYIAAGGLIFLVAFLNSMGRAR